MYLLHYLAIMIKVTDRIVVTGMATLNPLGDSLEGFIDNLLDGASGIKRWHSIDSETLACKIGGDLGDYDFMSALQPYKELLDTHHYRVVNKLFKKAPFSTKTAMLCALGASCDSTLLTHDFDPDTCAVIVGGHNFNSKYAYKNSRQFLDDPEYIDGLAGVHAVDSNVPGSVTEVLRVSGPAFSIGGACASGNLALREAFRGIVLEDFDFAVVVGPAFDMCEPDLYASEYINATAVDPRYQEQPTRASRPFDKNRGGFVYSHGAGAIVLEKEKSAIARGAHIYAELLAVDSNSNANHLPQPSSKMQSRLIRKLLHDSGLRTTDIDYINCHATGTPLGDIEEIRAIKDAFEAHAYKLKLNAPKSMLGHVCWSSPIVEMIGGILQMHRKKLHPSINIDDIDPEIDLDVCANCSVDFASKIMLNNSFGFGGLNSCAIIKYYE